MSDVLCTFMENLCQPLPAAILPGRPEIETSTAESLHSAGGSSDSEALGDGFTGGVLLADGLSLALSEALLDGSSETLSEALLDGPSETLSEALDEGLSMVLSEALDEGLSIVVSEALDDGLGSAYAAGAARKVAGAMTAVAAAMAIARRSFMKTSAMSEGRVDAARVW
ncbi:hypothetical protein [Streptomyces albipurpureus]|uniref:hypothetical protein n=1 Tax=Streptomyces albipurpureus TaxID=2897419 RepID=UPI0027E4D3C8|nr:hypothetical protein [Streptomyces sp. CWNU-1]